MAEGGEGIPGYEKRIVIMGQGLAGVWHVQTPGSIYDAAAVWRKVSVLRLANVQSSRGYRL